MSPNAAHFGFFLLAPAWLAASAHAEAPRWSPGHNTAAPVRGEVDGSRPHLGDDDGVYGRFRGDLFLGLGLGAELGAGTRGALQAEAWYYYSLGLAFDYTSAFGHAATGADAGLELSHSWSLALQGRPLFLPRWSTDSEFGVSWLDLTFDSLTLGAGYFSAEPARSGDRSRSGLEMQAGIGIPLFASARGLWLTTHASLRPALSEARGAWLLALTWYEPVLTPIVR